MGSNTSESESDSKLSNLSARMIIINDAHSDLLQVGNPDATDDTSADESSEEEEALSWRRAKHRRPTPGCYLCVQILDETDCISHSTNTLGKGMNPIILPPAMGK